MPRTIVGQLMAVLAGVLIIGQIVNLALLVGTQRVQARSIAYNTAIDYSVRMIEQLPEELPTDLPHMLRTDRSGPRGSFFLSSDNRSLGLENADELPRYNVRFQTALREQGINPLNTSVTFTSKSPLVDSAYPPPRRSRGQRQGNERTPPPERSASRDNDVFKPPPPPGFLRPSLGQDGPLQLQEIRLSAEIREGIWFNAFMPHHATESLTGRIIFATMSLLGFSLLAVWILARRISKPISEFTHAAERLGRGDELQYLPETGPTDLRRAASAFNIMQSRLTRMLETQRHMLRAVGHDLRTPLTSLRLRAENIADEAERDKVISTLDDMTVMTEEILSWARDAFGTEDPANVDLPSLLESLVDDYQDQGSDVALEDVGSITVRIRRTSVKRALQNLINNALQYGGSALLSVDVKNDHFVIHVDDEGSGVAESEIENILKPFVRLETSRNKDTGGTGLGLSISDTIAKIHGGSLTLKNREPKGLRASFSLPR